MMSPDWCSCQRDNTSTRASRWRGSRRCWCACRSTPAAAKGYRPITELAKERTLERIQAEAGKLLGPYRGEVEQAINDGPTLVAGMRTAAGQEPAQGLGSELRAAREAADRLQRLAQDGAAAAGAHDHLLPPEVYADNLHQYGVDISPRS